MPGTWRDMRAAYRLGADPYDPRDNIFAGAAYLRILYDRFGYPGLFAAYNAGPARYADHLATGRRLPAETIAYAAAVVADAPKRTAAPGQAMRRSALLIVLAYPAAPKREPDTDLEPAPPNSLFVRLGTPFTPTE